MIGLTTTPVSAAPRRSVRSARRPARRAGPRRPYLLARSLAVALAAAAPTSDAAGQAPTPSPPPAPAAPPADAARTRVLERAVAHVATRPDLVEALDVARGLTTATFELSCAISLLIPDEGGELPWWDVALGVGCLGASVGLFVANGLRLGALRHREEARGRARRLERAAADGLDADEATAFEAEIHEAAAGTRRTRAVGVTLGAASWVATGVLAWAAATDRIDTRAGTAIAVATFVAGGLGLSLVLVESPAERASGAIERLGGPRGGRPGRALRLAPWVGAGGGGLTLLGRW